MTNFEIRSCRKRTQRSQRKAKSWGRERKSEIRNLKEVRNPKSEVAAKEHKDHKGRQNHGGKIMRDKDWFRERFWLHSLENQARFCWMKDAAWRRDSGVPMSRKGASATRTLSTTPS